MLVGRLFTVIDPFHRWNPSFSTYVKRASCRLRPWRNEVIHSLTAQNERFEYINEVDGD